MKEVKIYELLQDVTISRDGIEAPFKKGDHISEKTWDEIWKQVNVDNKDAIWGFEYVSILANNAGIHLAKNPFVLVDGKIKIKS